MRCLCQRDLLMVRSCYDRPYLEHPRMVAVVVWQEPLVDRESKSMVGLLEGLYVGDVAFLEL